MNSWTDFGVTGVSFEPEHMAGCEGHIRPDVVLYIWPDVEDNIRMDVVPYIRPNVGNNIRPNVVLYIRPNVEDNIRPDVSFTSG